jgi:hypothetical protein
VLARPDDRRAGAPADAHDVSDADRKAARRRRERLHEALIDLEEALTAPTSAESWLPDLRAAVGRMRDTVLDHVAGAEAPDGLLAQVSEVSPWLTPRVTQLRDEHDDLVAGVDDLVAAVERASDPDEVSDAAWAVLQQVSRHRQRGADLLYDAYALDLSAGD